MGFYVLGEGSDIGGWLSADKLYTLVSIALTTNLLGLCKARFKIIEHIVITKTQIDHFLEEQGYERIK